MNTMKPLSIGWKLACCFCLWIPTLTAQSGEETTQRIGILLADRVSAPSIYLQWRKLSMPLEQRAPILIQQLMARASLTQPSFIAKLKQTPGVNPQDISPYWITNIVFCDMTAEAMQDIATWPEVSAVYEPTPLEIDQDVSSPTLVPSTIQTATPGTKAIKADQLWALGYTGRGRKVLIMDSGVDGTHPAFAGRYWGHFVPEKQAWFDPAYIAAHPSYYSNHGTHVLGTMVGLDPSTNDTIGVAFGANWMGANLICENPSCPQNATEEFVAAFQWALNPDGDTSTIADMPDVINNSWSDGGLQNECQNQLYQEVFSALEAAGVAIIFSAGNLGSPGPTVRPPKNINIDPLNTFCVGALNVISASPYALYSPSSRGPSLCGGIGATAIKPEVCAPGQWVRSSYPGNRYALLSGTSMAAPHVSGAILLLKEAFPYLDGTTLKEALYESAEDLGPAGEDNAYGRGIINVWNAYQYLQAKGFSPQIPQQSIDLALVDIQHVSPLICEGLIRPTIYVANLGVDTQFTFSIQYTYSPAGVGGNIPVIDPLPPGDTALVQLPATGPFPGTHQLTVKVLPTQGEDQFDWNNQKQLDLWYEPRSAPAGYTFPVCQGSDGVVFTHPEPDQQIRWYNAPDQTDPFFKGPVLYLPAVQKPLTVWAERRSKAALGPKLTSTIDRSFDQDSTKGIIFDVWQAFRLESVWVEAEASGTVTVCLMDADGNLVRQSPFNLIAGEQRLPLSWDIAPGIGQQIGIRTDVPLGRQEKGIVYPLQLPSILTITNSSLTAKGWNYLYDWEVSFAFPCGRNAFPIEVQRGRVEAAFDWQSATNLPTGNAQIEFLDQSQSAIPPFWYFGDGDSSQHPQPKHTYASLGKYQAYQVAFAASGCTDATYQTVHVTYDPLHQSAVPQAETGSLFPNPGQAGCWLRLPTVPSAPVHIEVYNLAGQIIPCEIQQLSATLWYIQPYSRQEGLMLIQVQTPQAHYALKWHRNL